MTLKKYLVIMLFLTVLSWTLWVYVVYTVNPEATNFIGFSLFYSTLFLSLVGTAAIIGFLMKFVIFRKKLVFHLVKESFRQSFLFSILIVASLFLMSKNLFSWTNIFFLVGAIALLEFLILSSGRKPAIKNEQVN